jgi:tetratricopeptide (TPR) repeat protein
VPPRRKDRTAAAATPELLQARAERAAREGRFQQALELARELHKLAPRPDRLQFLRRMRLGRARQLRGQGKARDAATVLRAAVADGGGDPDWLAEVAGELAQCGEVKGALDLLARAPDAAGAAKALGHAADAAVERGDSGRAELPPPLQADYDRVLAAFRLTGAGDAEAARAELQPIGLRSPFLEWKLLLRGLQAYYAGEDARALENWQRLTPGRAPARIAAPFRFRLDAAFRAAQPPEAQALLQRQFDRLRGAPLVEQLRQVQAALADPEGLAAAFRLAEWVLPALRREDPRLAERLAVCFYWAVLDGGPEDVRRYQRVFGRPAHDPQFSRLHALAHDKYGQRPEAHEHWQRYEREIAADPSAWPAGQADRVRALIWLHLGRNAAAAEETRSVKLPAYLRDLEEDRPRPLKPTAEQCLRRALELAPDLLEAHDALFRLHRAAGRADKAEKAARALLERFPDHAPALEGLSDLLAEKGELAEALALAQHALKANPLDRAARGRLVAAHLRLARALAEEGRFDDARPQYQAALALGDDRDAVGVFGRMAACEFKAGESERAEELLRQAAPRSDSALGLSYLMLTEAARLKLPRPLKARFEVEFKAGLEGPPDAAAAADLLRAVASFEHSGIAYTGQKTHAKKVMAYVGRCRPADFTEPQLEDVCVALVGLRSVRLSRRFADAAQGVYPHNPYFPFLLAQTYLAEDPRLVPFYVVKPLLERAERLARALPPDDRRDRLLKDVQERLKVLAALNPFAMGVAEGMFERLFGARGGDDEADD